ncbi:MAG TPA: hypothetical protein VFU17_12535 [Candidatus Limnocylindrales bacterium]|nr:hypothetical protein [Candidatus Limnocylindrales bacterium]
MCVGRPGDASIVLVAISASGSTPETVAAAERFRGKSLGLERVVTGRGGAIVRTPPIMGPARLVLPAFADVLAADLWVRAGAPARS